MLMKISQGPSRECSNLVAVSQLLYGCAPSKELPKMAAQNTHKVTLSQWPRDVVVEVLTARERSRSFKLRNSLCLLPVGIPSSDQLLQIESFNKSSIEIRITSTLPPTHILAIVGTRKVCHSVA